MNPSAFLDTNVILRHLLDDHDDHSARSHQLFQQIEAGEVAVRLTDTVVFEAAFTLEKVYRAPRTEIANSLQTLLALSGMVLTGKTRFRRVFALYIERASWSFADCYHVTVAGEFHLPTLISFDQQLGRFSDIARVEPPLQPAA